MVVKIIARGNRKNLPRNSDWHSTSEQTRFAPFPFRLADNPPTILDQTVGMVPPSMM